MGQDHIKINQISVTLVINNVEYITLGTEGLKAKLAMELWSNRILEKAEAEGFGDRFRIRIQGCSAHCSGCVNQHVWSFDVEEKAQVECLVSDTINIRSIEGTILLGGEPLGQKEVVTQLIEAVKRQGLSVISLTGYLYDDLKKSRDICVRRILRNIDLMINGPFIKNRPDFLRSWMGSGNQKCTFLSDKYPEKDLVDTKAKSQYEARIYLSGSVEINDVGDLRKTRKLLEVDGGVV